MLSAYH